MRNAIENAQKIVPDVELILWTGDNVPHIESYDESCKFYFNFNKNFLIII